MESGLAWPHPHAGVLWGGASWEGMPWEEKSICNDFSEDPAALCVSLVRTGGRWKGEPAGGNERLDGGATVRALG